MFLRHATASTWLLLEQTAAATLAWLTATEVLGHEAPFFAPIAAVVALNAALGERGENVLRLLLGVVIGICVGELTILVLGVGYGRLATATFVSMAIARALDESRIVIGQAAGSAILTVVALNGAEVGLDRLQDAFIGGGVALVFTQILFTPDPLALVKRAEAAGLTAIASNLRLAGHALEGDDVTVARRALGNMRDVRNRLVDLEQAMIAGPRVRRTSVLWRRRRDAVDREAERARRLDLLGTSCLLLARTALSVPAPERMLAAPDLLDLADLIADLANHFDDADSHRRAAERVAALARRPVHVATPPSPSFAATRKSLELVAADLASFTDE